MSDMALVASNALQSYQAALSTVSNNIANSTTDGYSDQKVVMVEGTPTPSGNVNLGTGAVAATVTRNYDEFANANVRTSTSQLGSQTSLLNLTNSVVNALGNSTSGLTASMDSFFNSLNQLSTNPASSVLRTSVLGTANALTSTFYEISGQLHTVDAQSQSQAQSDLAQINTLAKQIAQVNAGLSQNATLIAQPPAMLDQRDTLLKQLSQLVGINVSYSPNGSVNVNIDGAGNAGNLVNAQEAYPMSIALDASTPPNMTLSTVQTGVQYKMTGIASGDLSGVLTFRSQVLNPAMKQMSDLAQTIAAQVNQTQAQGIDLNGNLGQPLFKFDDSAATPADGIQVAITDPNLIAAAGPFNVQASSSNAGSATPSVSYQAAASVVPPALNEVLGNNSSAAVGKAITLGQVGATAVTTIPAGTQDTTIYMDPQPGQTLDSMQLQVLTRSGQQVLGSPLTADQQSKLLTTANGFNLGSTYNSQYLNQSGTQSDGSIQGYRGMNVFYGAQAQPSHQSLLTSSGSLSSSSVQPAVLNGGNLSLHGTGLAAGSFTLNGVAWPAIPAGSSAADIANLLNGVTAQTGVVASAQTTLTIPANKLTSSVLQFGLNLNGQDINSVQNYGVNGFASISDLANSINAQTNLTGVSASVAHDGSLVLNDPSGHDIDVEPPSGGSGYTPNALGLSAGLQSGELSFTSANTSQSVQLGFGATQVANTTFTDPNQSINGGGGFSFNVVSGSPPVTNLLSIPPGQDSPSGIANLISSSIPGLSASVQNLTNTPAGPYQLQIVSSGNIPFSMSVNTAANNGVSPTSLNFASPGNPATLANLGFRTAAYISGEAPDDLVVAVTGVGGVTLAATESGQATDPVTDLRNVPKQINFFDTVENSNDLASSNLNNGAPFNLNVKVGFPAVTKTLTVTDDSPNGIANALNAAHLGFTAKVTGSPHGNGNQVITLTGNALPPQAPQPFNVSLDSTNPTLANAQLNFSSLPSAPLGYNLIDNIDGTNLGGGLLSPISNNNASIQYNGVSVHFSGVPLSGDSFQLTGDQGRSGNNQNAVAMSQLSTAQVVNGSQTLNQSYSNFVSSVGNTANQANIAQTALTVVNNQAVATQSKISGVSLDTEASNLIRFQQGYQAAAKTIQVASQLFSDIFNLH
jgi:flagellar hook-associated protein FlgK